MKLRIKSITTVAFALSLLLATPLFAGQKNVMQRNDASARCRIANSSPENNGSILVRNRAPQPGATQPRSVLRMQSQDDGGCGLSCYAKILISTDFGRDVAPYPAFWVKVGVCTAKCQAME